MSLNKGMFTHNNSEWETPKSVYQPLADEFNITLDTCASKVNRKAKLYFDKKVDGLKQDWSSFLGPGEACWLNPPYGVSISAWVKKADEQAQLGVTTVALLPSRTDTRWFHDYILNKGYEIRFIKGRVKFVGSKNSAPFPSMVIIFKSKSTIKNKVLKVLKQWKKS